MSTDLTLEVTKFSMAFDSHELAMIGYAACNWPKLWQFVTLSRCTYAYTHPARSLYQDAVFVAGIAKKDDDNHRKATLGILNYYLDRTQPAEYDAVCKAIEWDGGLQNNSAILDALTPAGKRLAYEWRKLVGNLIGQPVEHPELENLPAGSFWPYDHILAPNWHSEG